jgi:hypothetical protein
MKSTVFWDVMPYGLLENASSYPRREKVFLITLIYFGE